MFASLNISSVINLFFTFSMILLLFDCWEHAYILQWADNIDMYIKKHLDIIDWEVVNYRIENQKQSKI